MPLVPVLYPPGPNHAGLSLCHRTWWNLGGPAAFGSAGHGCLLFDEAPAWRGGEVSKRPTSGTSKFSRLRLPTSWLRNAPIWSKLGLIMVVPTLATVVVGVLGLVDNINRASDADRARTLAGVTALSGTLVHELQNERAAATLLLGRPDNNARAAYDKQIV